MNTTQEDGCHSKRRGRLAHTEDTQCSYSGDPDAAPSLLAEHESAGASTPSILCASSSPLARCQTGGEGFQESASDTCHDEQAYSAMEEFGQPFLSAQSALLEYAQSPPSLKAERISNCVENLKMDTDDLLVINKPCLLSSSNPEYGGPCKIKGRRVRNGDDVPYWTRHPSIEQQQPTTRKPCLSFTVSFDPTTAVPTSHRRGKNAWQRFNNAIKPRKKKRKKVTMSGILYRLKRRHGKARPLAANGNIMTKNGSSTRATRHEETTTPSNQRSALCNGNPCDEDIFTQTATLRC